MVHPPFMSRVFGRRERGTLASRPVFTAAVAARTGGAGALLGDFGRAVAIAAGRLAAIRPVAS